MRKSKYLILSGIYFNFDDDLTDIINVKKLIKNQNILDLFRFDKIKSIKNIQVKEENINFIYLPQNIEIIDNFAFYINQIKILDLSNCIKLKNIELGAFEENQIKQLKLPENIEIINRFSFNENQIEILDLSNCIKLKKIEYYAFSSNPLKEIKILGNIEIEYGEKNKDDFWNKFVKYYNDTDKKSGDYKLENNKWQWYPL